MKHAHTQVHAKQKGVETREEIKNKQTSYNIALTTQRMSNL